MLPFQSLTILLQKNFIKKFNLFLFDARENRKDCLPQDIKQSTR